MRQAKQRHNRVPRRKRENLVVVLVSGGMDSTALLEFYLRERFSVRPLFVDFGQPAAKQELRAAKAVCKHYGLDLSIMSVRPPVAFSVGEILGRNAFLVFSAVLVFGVKSRFVAIGIHEGTSYYDCTESFLRSMQSVIDGYVAGRVKVAAPFLKWDKQLIWEFCMKARVPIGVTYSCEKGGVHPCGKCLSCKDRKALHAL